MPADELVACPACGHSVYRRASLCPRCGYAAEITSYQEQLSSLSTVCSILTGFGLASLVQLASDNVRIADSPPLLVAVGAWTISSMLFLVVLVLSELFRRQEVSESVIVMPPADRDRFARRCELLLTVFSVTLLLTALGVVLLGFHFSTGMGFVAVGGVGIAGLVILRAFR